MPALCYRQNAANKELYPFTRGETVRVLLASGDAKYVRWIGFVELDVAKRIPGGRPVKLEVNRYSNAPGWSSDWIDLRPGEYVQGCLTVEGVYAIIHTSVRIVSSSKPVT